MLILFLDDGSVERWIFSGRERSPPPEPLDKDLLWLTRLEFLCAAGEDLDWILENFVNLVHLRDYQIEKEPQIWSGDFARSICAQMYMVYRSKLEMSLPEEGVR